MPTPRPSADWVEHRIRDLPPSPTLRINERMRDLIASGRTIYRLGFGQSPFPVPELVVAALRAHAEDHNYLAVRGLLPLREAVAAHVERYAGVRYSPDRVIVGPGSKVMLFITKMVIDAQILIPSPSWVSYAPQARMLGRDVQWLPTDRADRWHLDPDTLRDHCERAPARPRLLVLNYPNNPNGATMDRARLEGIAAVARAYGVLILSDEIYGLVDHQGAYASIASVYPEGTIVTTGLSKWCGAGGWRVGMMLIPDQLEWLAHAAAVAAAEVYSCVSTPMQYAAAVAYRGSPEIDQYLFHARRILKLLGGWTADCLREGGLDVDRPDGGFYVFPDASGFRPSLNGRGIVTSTDFCERALEEAGVGLLPGSDFGRPDEEFTFRLSYVDFDGEAALAASAAIPRDEHLGEGFLTAHCPRVLEGVRHLAEWVTAGA